MPTVCERISFTAFCIHLFLLSLDWAVHGSAAFEEFLEFLGSKIELAHWVGYSGGLGTKGTSS